MNKQQFLEVIRDKINGLPQSDIEKSLEFYREMIDDRIEDGFTEEEAVEAMGSIDDIAAQIFMDTPLPKLVKAKVRPSRALRTWEIVLLILGSPVWVPLLLAACIIFLAIYVVIWSVVIVLYAADLCFAAAGITGIIAGTFLASGGNASQGLILIGAGMVCAGIAILLFFACNQVAIAVAKLGKMIIRSTKSRFIRREGVK